MSYIGQQLEVPEGYGPLFKERTYHFLGYREQIAVLAFFEVEPACAFLSGVPADVFEAAVLSKAIQPAPCSKSLPPWLGPLEGIDLNGLRKGGTATNARYESEVDRRLGLIHPLIEQERAILSSPHPEKLINAYARACVPKQNETRLRTWFLAYLAFGKNKWALAPAYKNAGRWERNKHEGAKFGRPSLSKGRKAGHPLTTEMKVDILDGFDSYAKFGRTFEEVILDIQRKKFHCKARRVTGISGKKVFELYQPDGLAFPSKWQIRRVVIKALKLRGVHLRLYGREHLRTKKSPSQGKFSELLANLLQRIEGDGYYVDERPTGVVTQDPMPRLCVVRIRCMTSGMIVGIGFSLGAETSEAYLMALFSMAIPKVIFCSLFGIEIEPDDWPSEGLPSWGVNDRGPGSAKRFVEWIGELIPMRGSTPSQAGQSKATVESSHPRKRNLDGAPTYIQSNKNYVQLAKKEIWRAITDNQTIQSAPRMPPAMLAAKVSPNPIGIWNYLDARMRTDASPIAFDDAVRTFCSRHEFTVCEDGVYFMNQRYDSDELRETLIHAKAFKGGRFKINGYALPLLMRKVWIEVEGRIVPAELHLPILDNKGQCYISVSELAELSQIRAELNSEQEEHRQGARAEMQQRYEDDTGKSWYGGRRRRGSPGKLSQSGREEALETKKVFSRRRAR